MLATFCPISIMFPAPNIGRSIPSEIAPSKPSSHATTASYHSSQIGSKFGPEQSKKSIGLSRNSP